VFDISLHKQDELSLVTKHLQNEHVTSGGFYIIFDVQKRGIFSAICNIDAIT
jgi:hypothetical protein